MKTSKLPKFSLVVLIVAPIPGLRAFPALCLHNFGPSTAGELRTSLDPTKRRHSLLCGTDHDERRCSYCGLDHPYMLVKQHETMGMPHKSFPMSLFSRLRPSFALILGPLGLCLLVSLQYSFWLTQTDLVDWQGVTSVSSTVGRPASSSLSSSGAVEFPQIVWLASFPNSGKFFSEIACMYTRLVK